MVTRLAVVISAIGIACPAVADITFMTPETASADVSSGQAVTANSTRLQTDSRLQVTHPARHTQGHSVASSP